VSWLVWGGAAYLATVGVFALQAVAHWDVVLFTAQAQARTGAPKVARVLATYLALGSLFWPLTLLITAGYWLRTSQELMRIRPEQIADSMELPPIPFDRALPGEWMVVIVRERVPEVTLFDDYNEAREFFDKASLQWSDSYLTSVLRAPKV
jgi:hypothetical protein